MSEKKWTPGPWEVKIPKRPSMTKRPSIEIDGKCSFVADFWGSCENAKANAILASTAPELYDALENALQKMEQMEEQIEGEWGMGKSLERLEKDGELSEEILQARAALAKARGGE